MFCMHVLLLFLALFTHNLVIWRTSNFWNIFPLFIWVCGLILLMVADHAVVAAVTNFVVFICAIGCLGICAIWMINSKLHLCYMLNSILCLFEEKALVASTWNNWWAPHPSWLWFSLVSLIKSNFAVQHLITIVIFFPLSGP